MYWNIIPSCSDGKKYIGIYSDIPSCCTTSSKIQHLLYDIFENSKLLYDILEHSKLLYVYSKLLHR